MLSPLGKKAMIEKLKKLKLKGKAGDGLPSAKGSDTPTDGIDTPGARKKPRPLIDLKIRALTKDSIESFITLQNAKGETVRKLAEAASKFRPERDGHMLSAFETSSLDYKNFRIMLKRVFFLDFTDPEFLECCELFDANKDGDIDGEEFLVCFSLLSSVWRDRERRKAREFGRKIEEGEREKAEKAAAEREAKLEEAADFTFSPEDELSVQAKIAAAAKLFDKNTSTIALDGFDAKFLKPGHFKDNLRLAFGIQLTRKELGALVKLYEYGDGSTSTGTGLVDCRNFMTAFSRMGVDMRREDHVKQLTKARQEQQKVKEQQEKILVALDQKDDVEIDYNFSEKDRESVLNKIMLTAVNYNRAQLGLDGFNGTYLTPGMFKEMVKRTFNLQFTPKELGAAVRQFDVDKNGKVSCQAFLVYFSKSALLERNRIHAEQCEATRKAASGLQEDQEKKIADKWKKYELKDSDFLAVTEADVKSALEKFTYAAKKIDKKSALGGQLFAAFQGSHLIPAVFKEVCRRCLEVTLTTPELAAMTIRYDRNGDRKEVDCNKFMIEFSTLSLNEMDRLRERQRKLDEAMERKRQEEERARLEQAKKRDLQAANFRFSDEDTASARAKFKHAASRFDKSNPNSSTIFALLQGQAVKISVIREMLKKGMNVEFTSKEFGSLVQPFLDEDDPRIANSAELMKLFIQLQNEYREEQRQRRIEAERALHHARFEEERKREEDKRAKSEMKLKHKEEDEKSLMVKLKRVAQSFVFDSAAYIPLLQSFKGPPLTPTVFSDTFFRVFLVRLTVPEVAVIMREVNPDVAKQHLVDGTSFVKTFLKLSRLVEKVLLGLMEEELVDINVFRIDEKAGAGGSQERSFELKRRGGGDGDGNGEDGNGMDSPSKRKQQQSWLKELLNGTNPYTDFGIAEAGYLRDFAQSRRNARHPNPLEQLCALPSVGGAAANSPSSPVKSIASPQPQRARTAPAMKSPNSQPLKASSPSPMSQTLPPMSPNLIQSHSTTDTKTKQRAQTAFSPLRVETNDLGAGSSPPFTPLPGEVGTWAAPHLLDAMSASNTGTDSMQMEAEKRPFSAADFTLDTWVAYRLSKRSPDRSPAKLSPKKSPAKLHALTNVDAEAAGSSGDGSPFLRKSRPKTFNSFGLQRRGLSPQKIAEMRRQQAATANLSSNFEAVAESTDAQMNDNPAVTTQLDSLE